MRFRIVDSSQIGSIKFSTTPQIKPTRMMPAANEVTGAYAVDVDEAEVLHGRHLQRGRRSFGSSEPGELTYKMTYIGPTRGKAETPRQAFSSLS